MRKELVFEDIRLFLCKHADHDVDYNTLIVTIFFVCFQRLFYKERNLFKCHVEHKVISVN